MAYENLKFSVSEKTGRVVISFDPTVEGTPASSGKSDIIANAKWHELSEIDDSLKGIKVQMVVIRAVTKPVKAAGKKPARAAKPEVDDDAGDDQAENEAPSFRSVKQFIMDTCECARAEAKAIYDKLVEDDYAWGDKPRAYKAAVLAAQEALNEDNDDNADEDGDEDEAGDDAEPAPRAVRTARKSTRAAKPAKREAKAEKPVRKTAAKTGKSSVADLIKARRK